MKNIALISSLLLTASASAAVGQARQVAIVPAVAEQEIMAVFTDACTLIGRVHEVQPKAIVCNTTRIGARHQSFIRMTYTSHVDGWSIETQTAAIMGPGLMGWMRSPSNYTMDITLARLVLDSQSN